MELMAFSQFKKTEVLSSFLQTPQFYEFMAFCITSAVFFSTNEVVCPHTSAYDASLFFYLLYSMSILTKEIQECEKMGSSFFQCTVIPRSQFEAGLSGHHPGSNSINNLPLPRWGPHTAIESHRITEW